MIILNEAEKLRAAIVYAVWTHPGTFYAIVDQFPQRLQRKAYAALCALIEEGAFQRRENKTYRIPKADMERVHAAAKAEERDGGNEIITSLLRRRARRR